MLGTGKDKFGFLPNLYLQGIIDPVARSFKGPLTLRVSERGEGRDRTESLKQVRRLHVPIG
jgi:hypothetical protein